MKKYLNRMTIIASLLIATIIICLVSVMAVLPQVEYAQADTAVSDSAEKRYYSAQNVSARSVSQESINYTSYSVLIDSEITGPAYYNLNKSLSNVCGAVAGANIIGYYDYEFPNLIPNYESAIMRGPVKIYKWPDDYSQNLLEDLYIRMETNTGGMGVSQTLFNNGLKSYINAAGYSVTMNDLVSNGQISANVIKTNIENGTPMICFCTMQYYISNISIGSGVTTLSKNDYQVNHIMIVNGIKQIAYYQGSNNFRTDTYLKVALGLQDCASAYILLSSIELDRIETLSIK